MQRALQIIRRAILSLVIIVQVFFPSVAFAEEATATSSADTPIPSSEPIAEEIPPEEEETPTQIQSTQDQQISPPEGETGPGGPTGETSPTGPASNTYKYNEETGLWENEHYTWDPVTRQTKPKTPQEYSYNPTTGMWDTSEWYWSPEQGKYLENRISVASNPNAGGTSGNASIDGTGPGSNNSIELGDSNNSAFDLFFDATISNKIGQMSVSGDATVDSNLLAGNATTGDAETLLNMLNMLQSAWGELGSDIATFSADINGDVVGDLYIDPSLIPAGRGGDIDVNVSHNAQINNDIEVTAQSGDAGVTNNTTAGNATTGDARAMVNLINMINSAIYSNRSFVGVLNINGNLDGDILLPPALLKAIIASSGANSTNTINASSSANVNVDVATNQIITNDIQTDAQTGDALIANNTNAGNATTGNAQNNIVLLNLTGHQVVAKNALIVFVNVMGSWVGLIMDAPAGTYAVAATGPDSTNTITANGDTNVDVNITENSQINNTVRASARSGDATVMNNTNAGNATTGDATVSVNALNMIGSNFTLSDWFGVLFINVFGSWNGSFGVNTAAGNRPLTGGMGAGTGNGPVAEVASAQTQTQTQTSNSAGPSRRVFEFVPASSSSSNGSESQVASAVADVAGQVSSTSVDESNIATDENSSTPASRSWITQTLYIVAITALLFGAVRWWRV